MPFTDSVLHDLCIICADAPNSDDRGAAHRLLCREMQAHLRNSGRDFNHFGDHPAFVDAAITPDTVQSLESGHLVTHEVRTGGIRAATFYFYHRDGSRGCMVPRASDGDYSVIFPALSSEATALISSVRSAMTDGWMDAKRHRIQGYAAPGSAFASQEFISYSVVPTTNTNTGETVQSQFALTSIVLDAGTWRVQVTARVRSESTTPGASVGFAVELDGFAVITEVHARAVATFGSDIDVVTDIDTTVDALISSGTKTLTIVNTTSSIQSIDGIVRFWKP